jgi:hypothetical protein
VNKRIIAQEVLEVIPSAVNTHEGCVPDIFQVPEKVFKNSCQFKTKIEGVQIGDIVRVLTVIRVSDFEINFDYFKSFCVWSESKGFLYNFI